MKWMLFWESTISYIMPIYHLDYDQDDITDEKIYL